ncbi:MAG: 23S rRNA (adenine(2030)-N(6))-methyltransferase RlmJ [Micropepsaceae bacterium]
MNYRHSYHAGNFADVLKHAVLCWTIRYLQQKEAPLCLIDTHAGSGVYDLTGTEAGKTLEARDGVLRLLDSADVPTVFQPYLGYVRAQGVNQYPGSPSLLKSLARRNDRVALCELHPEEAGQLRHNMGDARNLRVIEGDGYRKLQGLIPPAEKRGVVLIDPPFEQPDELSVLASEFIAAYRKWPTGVFMLWFPVKDQGQFERFTSELQSALIPKLHVVTLDVDRIEGLSACGLILANAPYTFESEWKPALAWLGETLSQGPNPASRCSTL